ncbi:MAG: UDP-2,3-diacylglucosamine hydrolase [Campylobacterota bacterium]|nr:UDP-2,3-diacylglucosamine hydrolase [Campylobacterota bacterium]
MDKLKRKEPGRIKDGALFVADSHYPHHGDAFLVLLQKIASGEIAAPQLFLMGDNFDLLFGYNEYIQTFSKEAIVLLQSLSKTLEIHYFEGNHDFCLSTLFPNMNVYTREQQPVFFSFGEKKIAISHGDKYATGFIYDLYCKILRNPAVLTLLKPFEKSIINHQMAALSKKEICRRFDGFKKRVDQILSCYQEVDCVVEGHFHQSRIIGKYISLPSLACQKKVGVFKNGKMVFEEI